MSGVRDQGPGVRGQVSRVGVKKFFSRLYYNDSALGYLNFPDEYGVNRHFGEGFGNISISRDYVVYLMQLLPTLTPGP